MIDREIWFLPLLILALSLGCMCERYGFPSQTLHLYESDIKHDNRHVSVFNMPQSDDLYAGENDEVYHSRSKRDASSGSPNGNITTRINHLNDNHQQLMVHWVGEGSAVIICLARDASQPAAGPGNPSAVYVSYDYGDTFENKTESFQLGDTPEAGYAQLDKFYNHPNINSFCVFTDIKNKMLYQTSDNVITLRRTNLTFTPSLVSYDESDPYTFVILDKVDTMHKLYLTRDGGITFNAIEEYVRSFFWSSGPDNPTQFYVQRAKPYGSNAVLVAPSPTNYTFKEIIDDVQEFQIKGDFMFASKKAGPSTMNLHISYQRGPFVKAEFQTELDLKEFHISDVTDNRIFISVSHTDTLANLYVSEISKNFTEFKFVLSLESILCHFPNSTWNKGWLRNISEEPFIDLYKVQGLRGIYIASKVVVKPAGLDLRPEHLMSYITFDHGNTWGNIKPPKQDDEGQPINCVLIDDCSLHLSQKFNQLYPVTRSATIMSSKSAPGIIMATGVVGKSLKGHPGLFISRDAGLTWKQILRDYYFFNYGDHGGALVAVRYFKNRGETRELLYSTDEGEKWLTHDFHENDLKIYGLMTEPGENTTVFTMFGSAQGDHQWVIIKVDLFKAFSYNCTIDDYKYWSPSSTDVGSKVPCILGVTDTYQRRIPHANCYNGQNYDRPVKQEICQCDRQDFECDFGFFPTGHPSHCIRNQTLVKFDPYAVPGHCRPGEFYNRTKGYRKIDGDSCIDGFAYNYLPDLIPCPMNETPEFLIFAQRERIARITLGENKLEILPVNGLQNVIAIDFDIRNNCLYWADIVSDVIKRQCLGNGNNTPEIIVETDLASIEGMALDWISNVLFFVDGMRAKIECVRTDLSNEGRMRRTILGPSVLTKPRGIAAHPTAGYLFWTDWATNSPSVSRSNMDGTDVKRLFIKPVVEWPNGITVDHIAERIYWVDAMEDYIASSDLNGQRFKKVFANDERVSHPFAVAVFKDTMYWDDWKSKAIFSADKDHGVLINTIRDELTDLMDLKVYARSLQVGTNACASKDHNCQALCLGMPGGNYSCLCPDGLTMKDGRCMCPGANPAYSNMTCPKPDLTVCTGDQFMCNNSACIPSNWRCDGDNDCGDSSDEVNCVTATCQPQMILCDTNKCIPHYYRCDHDEDCLDGSDEKGCTYSNCTSEEFKCKNGKCISNKWRCDGEDDCRDNSDELDCKESHVPTCKDKEFRCPTNGQCIPKSWVCDGENDCPDSADELKSVCKEAKCMDWMFKCPGNGKCVYNTWVCDGEDDCQDGLMSDEQNCSNSTGMAPIPAFNFPVTAQCHNWMYLCNNTRCIPYWWKCDGINDCGDNSDELGCGNVVIPSPPEEKKPNSENGIDLPSACKKNHYMCANGDCIPAAWVCDGAADCEGGEDELACEGGPTGHCKEFRCRQDGACITLRAVCDGKKDCVDGSDEFGCQILKNKTAEKNSNNFNGKCANSEFACDNGKCISLTLRCNQVEDCYDGTDELNCSQADVQANMLQLTSLNVDSSTTNASTITLYWQVNPAGGARLQFLPTISETTGPKAGVWRNASSWFEERVYMFTNLKPYTEYNMTAYVRMVKSTDKEGQAPNMYFVSRTGEGIPSQPLRLVARQMAGRRVQVQWDPPAQPNGRMRQYQVLVSPPLPPASLTVPATDTQAVLTMGHFKPGNNYTFWVVAKNYMYQSNSEAVTLLFDAMGDIDDLQNLKAELMGSSTMELTWDPIRQVDGYRVRPRLPLPYPELETYTTKNSRYTLTNLSPGVTYTIEVRGFKDDMIGKPSTVYMSTVKHPLPSVEGVGATLVNSTSVLLSWRPPKDKSLSCQYAVYYGLNMEQMFKTSKLITSNTSLLIENLQACDSYMFSVGLYKPAIGPLTNDPVNILTEYNHRAPVRNLLVKSNSWDPKIMEITWDSTCNTVTEFSEYIIIVTDLNQNKTSTLKLPPTNNSSMTHIFNNMQYGGSYNVTVLRNVPKAQSCWAMLSGPALPPPQQLRWHQAHNGSFLLDWATRTLPASLQATSNIPQYHYEVSIIEEDNSSAEERVFPAGPPPFQLPELSPGSYVARVRMITNTGYRGALSEARTLVVPQDMWIKSEQSSMSLFVGIPLAVVAVCALIALTVLALKHRRLSSSFVRFANPRYDSRSGAATLGNTSDILDEDEAPPIRGFADDEPLVIA